MDTHKADFEAAGGGICVHTTCEQCRTVFKALGTGIILSCCCVGVKRGLTHSVKDTDRMFENVALRKIFGPKREKVTGDWRKQHNEQLRGLYCSRNIQVAKSGRMSLGGGGAWSFGGET